LKGNIYTLIINYKASFNLSFKLIIAEKVTRSFTLRIKYFSGEEKFRADFKEDGKCFNGKTFPLKTIELEGGNYNRSKIKIEEK
jgi:hypothetical protein